MALLQILLLLLYALPSLLLPITSNPLGLEDTPENLAYAVQSLEGRPEHEGVRKIPKSIFITPEHQCQPGFHIRDGICTQDFSVNPLQLLLSQVNTFVQNGQTTTDYEEYDYDSYDSTESNGPYHVPLSLNFDDDPPNRDKNKDGIQNMPFLADNVDRQEETPQNHQASFEHNTNKLNVVPLTTAVPSNLNEWNDDILADGKVSTGKVEDVKSTTVGDLVATSSDESLVIYSDGMSVSTTQKKNLVDFDEENVPSTELNLTTADKDIEPCDGESTTLTNNERIKLNVHQTHSGNRHLQGNCIESTTQIDDKKALDKELQSESLFADDSLIGTSISVSDGTTEISENDLEATTESLNSVNDREINKPNYISTPIAPFKLFNPFNLTNHAIVVVPTVEQVQIVTPVQLTSHSTTSSHHRKKPNNQSIPSSTSAYDSELQTAERLDINSDSMLNKKLRESVMKHELNEDAIETIDTNNRFVYTHLDTSSNEPVPSSTTTSTTMQPITQRSVLDQLRFANKFIDESRKNNRVRFPEPSAVNIFSNFKGGTVKFPGPVQQRTSEPLFNRLIPDLIPKKPPEPTRTERPLFSWLPAGTSFDFNRNSSPAFMRFWNKMPLIRDQSMGTNDTPEQPRSNSKSPTDNLYKDAPASEVYKVISSKNYKHDNR